MNKINQFLTGILMLASAGFANAQSFVVDDPISGGTTDPNQTLVVEQSTIAARISAISGFTTGDKLYFYYVNQGDSPTNLNEDRIIAPVYSIPSSVPATKTFSGTIDELGTFDLYVAHFSGRFDHQYDFTADEMVDKYGTSSGGFAYLFNQAGDRSITTPIHSLSGETVGDVFLKVDFWNLPSSSNAVEVHYSTNGSTWTLLADTGGVTAFDNSYINTGYFSLPAGAINANTRFRVRQTNTLGLTTNSQAYYLIGMQVLRGTAIQYEMSEQVYSSLPSSYVITTAPVTPGPETPDMLITDIQDDVQNSIGSAQAGDTITILLDGNLDFAFSPNSNRFRVVNSTFLGSSGSSGLVFPILASGGVSIANDLVVNPTKKIITIRAIVPHNIEISDYTNHNLTVMYLDSTVVDFGQGAVNYYDGSGYNFNYAGLRSYTLPAQSILSGADASLQFYLSRVSTAVPPAGVEIEVQYSTDGFTYNTLTEISLTDVGVAGATILIDTMPSIVESAATYFRIVQKDTTLLSGVHTWYIEDISLISTGADPAYETAFNYWSHTIIAPGFSIALDDPNAGPLYSGDLVQFNVTANNGSFPDNTVFEIYGSDNTSTYLIGTLANAPENGDQFTVTAPFTSGMQTIILRAESKQSYMSGPIAQAWDQYYLQSPQITIDSVGYINPTVDGGMEYTGPGEDMYVEYTLMGSIDNALVVNAELQIQDNNGNWFTLDSELAGATGVFANVEVPHMDLGSNPNIRVILTQPATSQYDDAYLERLGGGFTVGPFTVNQAAKFGFHLYTQTTAAQTVNIEMSSDNGTTWTVLASKNVLANYNGFLFHYAADQYALNTTGSIWFRVSDPVAGNSFTANGYRLQTTRETPVVAAYNSIDILYPSITFNDIYLQNVNDLTPDNKFMYGQSYDLKYSTRGAWENATAFAFALVRNNKYLVLAQSAVQGSNTISFTVPSKDSLFSYFGLTTGASENFDFYAYAYSTAEYSDLRLDMGGVSIGDASYFSTSQNVDMYGGYFYAHTGLDSRFVTANPVDLSNLADSVFLNFGLYNYIDNPTLPTLPRVQISNDGGATFVDMDVPGATVPQRLPNNVGSWYPMSLPIPTQYLTNATVIRWYQEIGDGDWAIQFPYVFSAGDNEVDLYFRYDPMQVIAITDGLFNCADYNNTLSDYSVAIFDTTAQAFPVDVIPSAYAGSNFDFSVTESVDNYDDLPVGTDYYVYLRYNNSGYVTDPVTGDEIVFGPYAALNDTFTVNMPAFVGTGVYDFEIVAEYVYDTTMSACSQSGYMDINLFVINEENDVDASLVLDAPANATQYGLGDDLDVTYSAFGTYPAGVKFGAVISAYDGLNEIYEELGQSTTTGSGQMITGMNMLTEPWVDINGHLIDQYDVCIVAYQGTAPVLANQVMPLEADDYTVTGGVEFSGDDLEAILDGDRTVTSVALDLSGQSNVTLEFDYYGDNILASTSTLPQLQVSTDGVNFDTLAVTGTYGALGLLEPTGWHSYIVAIDSAYLTANTWFRWTQPVNSGAYSDDWYLYDVEVRSGVSNVYNNLIDCHSVDLNWAQLANYTWNLDSVMGLEPTLFNGGMMPFEWNLDIVLGDTLEAFPAGTVVDFALYQSGDPVVDPATGLDIFLGSTTQSFGTYSDTLPFLLNADWYDVYATATLNGEILEEGVVASIRIHNDAIRTTLLNANPNVFAGDSASFAVGIENTVNTNLFDSIYFNLMVTYGGEDWLLASQQGLNDTFDVVLPPFVHGNVPFWTAASQGAPVGTVGMPVTGLNGASLNSGDFYGNYPFVTSWTGAAGNLYTDALDLTEVASVEFKIKSSLTMDELSQGQFATFAYSIDGGTTFSTLGTYPDMRFTDSSYFDNEDTQDFFNEFVALPTAAQTENTILRWFVDESNGTIEINSVMLNPVTEDFDQVPANLISLYVNLLDQRIDITSTDAVEYCYDGTVDFNYSIRGSFGSETRVRVLTNSGESNPVNYHYVTVDGDYLEYTGITAGNGTIALDLSMMDTEASGADRDFRLIAVDETNEDYSYSISGELNIFKVDFVDRISPNTNAYAQDWYSSYNSCSSEERFVLISNVQPYFGYHISNYTTGAPFGPMVIADPADTSITTDSDALPYYNVGAGTLKLPIGLIAGYTQAEVMIVARAESGLVCDSLILTTIPKFDIRPAYALHYDNGGTGVWTKVTGTETFTICEGSTDLELAVGYYQDGSFTNVWSDWYRNSAIAPLGSTSNLYNFGVSGDYFAMIDDGDCASGESPKVHVVVDTAAAQPAITVAGSLEVCENDTVVLNAPAGYNYYEWTKNSTWSIVGGNTQSYQATESGMYYVKVSDVPFGTGCTSAPSNPVAVEVTVINNVWFGTSSISLCSNGNKTAEVAVNTMQNDVTYQMFNLATGAPFGAPFASSSGNVTIITPQITADMQYGISAVSDLNAACGGDVNGNILTISILDTVGAIITEDGYSNEIASGATHSGCGDGFSLSASTDGLSAIWVSGGQTVTWYLNGAVHTHFTSGWATINPTESGVYSARIVDGAAQDDCEYFTPAITVTINAAPAQPVISVAGNTEFCEGESNLVLTATAGAATYNWFRNGGVINDVTSNASSIDVTLGGTYTVSVESAAGCESGLSLPVDVTMHGEPNAFGISNVNPTAICDSGAAYIMISGAETDVEYQLYNVITGQPSGNAKYGQPNLVLVSDVLNEDVMFEVRATRLGSGCSFTSNVFEVEVNVLTITAVGNVLISSITNASHYQWYRNGEMVLNNGNGSTLTVFDSEEYTLEVTVAGCDLESTIGQRKGPKSNAVVQAPGVYPNPVDDKLTVYLKDQAAGVYTIEVLNSVGQVVLSENITKTASESMTNVDVDGLSSGVYTVRVSGTEYNGVTRIVKN